MQSSSLKLTDLIDLVQLQKIQDAFAEATGVASIITDVDGIPITKPSNFCRLCSEVIRKTEKGCQNCMRSDAALGKLHPNGPIMQPCLSGGLWDGGTSICVGDRHIANWLIGQIRNDAQNEETMLAYAREIGADLNEFKSALDEVTVMSVEQFAKVCNALYLIARQISSLAFHNMALHQSEANLQTTLDSIGDAVIAADTDGNILRMNPIAERLTGWKLSDAAGRSLQDVFRIIDGDSRKRHPDPAEAVIATGRAVHLHRRTILIDKDGKERFIADSASPIRSEDGSIAGVVLVFRDVTEQLHLEEQMHQSQKMDAIGQLAGGVAHDFNNMLGGILGAADLLGPIVENNPQAKKMVDLIIGAAEQASSLTQMLLDFSRKGKTLSTPISVHDCIGDAVSILQHSIDRRIEVVTRLEAEAPVVVGDPTQLQNAFLNLGINARDAMPEGGTLIYSTENIRLDQEETSFAEQRLRPGLYLVVSVSDTGTGIRPHIISRIFEPFFTTKEVGTGTGLGLASVYATVQEHHGRIQVYSELQKGTVFRIYLPVEESFEETEKKSVPTKAIRTGSEKILLADDEPFMRMAAEMILQSLGYHVVLAENGEDACNRFESNPDEFDLVILDVVMPKKSGRDAFLAIRKRNKTVPVIFSSGFTREHGLNELLSEPGVVGFLQKPFRKTDVAEMLARVLHSEQ